MLHTAHPSTHLAARFIELVSNPPTPKITVLVGGGSIIDALNPVFAQMAELGRSWDHLTLGMTDERFASDVTHQDANITKLSSLSSVFQLVSAGMELHDILVKDANLISTGKYFADFLEQTVTDPHQTLVGLLGVGADFHTVGILPHRADCEYLFHESLATAYRVDEISSSTNPHRERVTISFTGISKLDRCWVYAVGEEKRQVLEPLLSAKQPVPVYNEKPALYLWELPELEVFTDLQLL